MAGRRSRTRLLAGLLVLLVERPCLSHCPRRGSQVDLLVVFVDDEQVLKFVVVGLLLVQHFVAAQEQLARVDRHDLHLVDALDRVQLALADDRVVLEDPERGDQGLEGGGCVPPHLQRVEVDVSQERVGFNLDGLEVDDELLEGLQAQDLGLEADQDPHCEVEDEVFVSLEKEDLPELVKEAELDDACVKRGHEARCVHLDGDVLPAEVIADLFVCIRQEQVC